MASLAASQLAQIFASTETEKVISLLNLFASHLANGPKPLDSPILALCNSLALGSLLGRLFEEHFSEMTGSKVGFSEKNLFLRLIVESLLNISRLILVSLIL